MDEKVFTNKSDPMHDSLQLCKKYSYNRFSNKSAYIFEKRNRKSFRILLVSLIFSNEKLSRS